MHLERLGRVPDRRRAIPAQIAQDRANVANSRLFELERPKGFEPSTFSLGSLRDAITSLFAEGGCDDIQKADSPDSGDVREMPDLAARCRAAQTLLLIARASAESEPLVSAALTLLDSALASLDAPPASAGE